jgi:hypothetical protein
LVGNLKRRNHLGDIDVNGRTISKWILKILYVRMLAGFTWLKLGSILGHM